MSTPGSFPGTPAIMQKTSRSASTEKVPAEKVRRGSVASNTARRLTNPSSDAIVPLGLDGPRSQRYTPLFTLLTGIAGAYFLTTAAGTCPSTANKTHVNKAQCTLSVWFAVVFGLVTLFSIVGIIRHGETPTGEEG